METNFLGGLGNLDNIIVFLWILGEPETSPRGPGLPRICPVLGLKQNLQGIKNLQEMSCNPEKTEPNPLKVVLEPAFHRGGH